MHRPGVELALFRLLVRRRNHYTTEPTQCSKHSCYQSSRLDLHSLTGLTIRLNMLNTASLQDIGLQSTILSVTLLSFTIREQFLHDVYSYTCLIIIIPKTIFMVHWSSHGREPLREFTEAFNY